MKKSKNTAHKQPVIEQTSIFAVHLGGSKVVSIDKYRHILQVHTKSQTTPILEVKDIPSMINLRDLLIDAYPMDKFTLRNRVRR